MKTEDQIKALSELDGIKFRDGYTHLPSGFYYTDSYARSNCLIPNYQCSYDAILPLIQKQDLTSLRLVCEYLIANYGQFGAITRTSPAQLCEALLRATGKWTETP